MLPWPTPALSAQIPPPCISTILRAMANPSPSPPSDASHSLLPRRNGWKICSRYSGAMPMPVSLTSISASRTLAEERMVIEPPVFVYLIAFSSRLFMTWLSLVLSPKTVTVEGHSRVSMRSSFSLAV